MTLHTTQPLALLGGLSPRQFMDRHWQRKPLLVRGAIGDMKPLLSRAALFDLAARDEVESRLVVRSGGNWKMRRAPSGPRCNCMPTARRPCTASP